MNITVDRLTLAHGSRTVVHGVSFEVAHGEMLGIIGPNGSGKSTLLRGMSRLHRPLSGRALIGETDVHALPARQLARILAVLPQSPDTGLDLTVAELVWRGRHPHQGILQRARPADYDAVSWALDVTELREFAGRPLAQLSGGERQRAWMAMALAQEPRVLLLDEPTSFLDIRHQVEVMELIRRLNRDGLTVVAVLHDLFLASRYCDRVLAMRDGAIEFLGPPGEAMQPDVMERVFSLPMDMLTDPATGLPVPLPRPLSPSYDSSMLRI